MLRQYYLDSTATHAPDALLKQSGILAVIAFDDPCTEPSRLGFIPIGTPSLVGKSYEVIQYSNEVAQRGKSEGCHWSSIGDVLCVATWIAPEACADITLATYNAYQRLFKVMQQTGYGHPFRVWNFIPDINQGAQDQEEYKKFCVGRQLAFNELDLAQQQYPAASALGNSSKGAVIYLLASRTPVWHHENPRQQPAYHYPREYGPSSPAFARATSLPHQQGQQLFISGTASIVGHNTKAVGDLQEQLEITLNNIQLLLQSIDPNAGPLEAVRVYLRYQSDLVHIQASLRNKFPVEAINFLQADICRDNLLLEIEALSYVNSAS